MMKKSISQSESAGKRPPLCASSPLLWSLLPLAMGIFGSSTRSPLYIVTGLLACVAASLLVDTTRRTVVLSSFLGGFILMSLRTELPHEDWRLLPPRETSGLLEITELFSARKPGHLAGIGVLLSTTIPSDTVSSRPVAFYLNNVAMKGIQPGLGEIVEFRGIISYLPFLGKLDDYQLYLMGRDISLSLNQGEILASRSPPPRIEQMRLNLRNTCRRALTHGSSGPGHPGMVLASMLLGDRSLLSEEQTLLYKQSGTFHLFAVSGLHVGSFAICLHLLTGLVRIPQPWRILPVLLGTWSYVWLTGSSPSAIRAGIMVSCLSIARYLLRQPHLFPSMILSAWLVLVYNPRQLFDLGFQLSYGVVTSIILVGLPMAKYFRERLESFLSDKYPKQRWQDPVTRFVHSILDLSCVSISAGMASMPLIVQHFGLFAPGGIFLGILLNPIASLTVMLGCLTMLAGIAFGSLPAGWMAMATWPGILLMEWLIALCLKVPGAVSGRSWPWPHAGTMLLLGTLMLAWWLQWMRQNRKMIPAATLFLPLLVILTGLSLTTINA